MVHQIVILGCSLSAQDGYAKYITQHYQNPVVNLAVSAGSNDLQQFRLTNLFADNQINKDSVLLWQVTTPNRKFMFSPCDDDSFCHGVPFEDKFDWLPQYIAMTGEASRIWLGNNPKVKPLPTYLNASAALQVLAIDIIKWSWYVGKIFVTLGWKNMVEPDVLDRFVALLSKHGVYVLPYDQCIVDWCRENKQTFTDMSHPDESGYINWFRASLEPHVKTFLTPKEFKQD